MTKLLILGAGGHGQVVAETAQAMKLWGEICFVDNKDNLSPVLGFNVVGKIEDLGEYKKKFKYAFVAIGNNVKRLELQKELLKHEYVIPTIVHPNSYMSPSAIVGKGSLILPGVVVNTNVTIGDGCIININSTVDHDTNIGCGVHIMSGAVIRSNVKIGDYASIGAASCISSDSVVPNQYVLNDNERYKLK